MVALYSENRTKHTYIVVNRNAELLNVKAGGAYSYHTALKFTNA
jgi:hypothetical protein